MKITVFTSNQPRHLSLIRNLSMICDQVFAVQECNTVFPGMIKDFYTKSDVMEKYFAQVRNAELETFGNLSFSSANVRSLSIKGGDLSLMSEEDLRPALESDVYVVFGASFIKGWLIDFLVSRKAINIHMGVSPYYRGSSCNFWAVFDGRPQFVGSTIHLLTKGLDSGPILYHAMPTIGDQSVFLFTMQAVAAAHESIVHRIEDGSLFTINATKQDKALEIRYTRNSDFTDEVASVSMDRFDAVGSLSRLCTSAEQPTLILPYLLSSC
jgi:hypothetical protein